MCDPDAFKTGDVITFPGRSGWMHELIKTENGFDFRSYNLAHDGKTKMFFEVSSVGNLYGAPVIVQEPTLKVPCCKAGVDIAGDIIGAIVLNEEGRVVERYSWSNLVYMQGKKFEITFGGQLFVGEGEAAISKGYLQILALVDKNRIVGYVGVFGPRKPEKVETREMLDLLISQ